MNYITLEQVNISVDTCRREGLPWKLCNVRGFFIRAEKIGNNEIWILGDDTLMEGLPIKLAPPLDQYMVPEPGDVVRIHRLGVDKVTKALLIVTPHNVVVWPSFKHATTGVSSARRPTMTPADEEQRKKLEALYCSKICQISEIKNHSNSQKLISTSGRVEEKTVDRYGHLHLVLFDGTAKVTARIFTTANQTPSIPTFNQFETNEHFERASKTNVGDYVFIGCAKLDPKSSCLNLSTSKLLGRTFKIVEKNSILGSRITQSVTEQPDNQIRPASPLNTYTRLGDIPKFEGYATFYNIAGQVRGAPLETEFYANWVLQIHDGSRIDYQNFYIDLVKEPLEDCAVAIVYSKQTDRDTDVHVETVKKIKDADLIIINNIKASWKDSKLKLELNANLEYGKSIELVDKNSHFGMELLDIVTNPLVEELFEEARSDDE